MKSLILFISFFLYAATGLGAMTDALIKQTTVAGNDRPVRAIVWLKESLSETLTRKGVAKLTPYHMKQAAQSSQQSLLDAITHSVQSGEAANVQSLWLINAVAITAKASFFETIKNRNDIDKIDINPVFHLLPTPKVSTSMKTTEFAMLSVQPNITQIRADTIWDDYRLNGRQLLGTGVKVAVLDTGIDATHPLLSGNIIAKKDFGGDDATASDHDGHGTHVAGIIAAGNGIGVAPGVSLLIGRVFDNSGNGDVAKLTIAAQWAIDQGAKIVNMSLGDTDSSAASAMQTMVNNLYAMGVISSAAIGNNGPGVQSTTSPGNCIYAIGVGAVNGANVIANFSSRGPVVWGGTTYYKPDLSAPGVEIYSTLPASKGTYGKKSGTSQATPHLSGVCALMLDANSSLSPNDIKSMLQTSATAPSGTTTNVYGSGILDAFNAVALTDKTLPTLTHTPLSRAVADSAIRVTADITDNVSRLSGPSVFGSVYYHYPNASWQSLSLTWLTGNTFYVDIPAQAGAAEVEYYLAIRDLNPDNVVRRPASSGTYTIILRDVQAPSVTHTSTGYYALGVPIVLTANITDNVDPTLSARVYYRTSTSGAWQTASLNINATSVYSVTLSAINAQSVTMQYYFETWDSVTNTATLPASAPASHYSLVGDFISPRITFHNSDHDYLPTKKMIVTVTDNYGVGAMNVYVDNVLLSAQYVSRNGTSAEMDLSSYADGTYRISITAIDLNGNITTSTEVMIILGSASTLRFMGPTDADSGPLNAPNPFNPATTATTISFRLPKAASIEIRIYDRMLKHVQTLTNATSDPASGGLYYSSIWNGRGEDGLLVPNGLYYYIVKATASDGSGSISTKGKLAVLQ